MGFIISFIIFINILDIFFSFGLISILIILINSYLSNLNYYLLKFFNDLKLNEYYRNLDPESTNFNKLVKVEIPDIFDNSVEGWTENDFIKNQ